MFALVVMMTPLLFLHTLGWTLNGPVTSQPTKRMVTSNLIYSTNIEKKPYQLSQFESVKDFSAYSHKDIRKLQSWDKECRVLSDQFHIPIPWRDSGARLPDNLYLGNICLDIVLESPHLIMRSARCMNLHYTIPLTVDVITNGHLTKLRVTPQTQAIKYIKYIS